MLDRAEHAANCRRIGQLPLAGDIYRPADNRVIQCGIQQLHQLGVGQTPVRQLAP